jgi:hypothetical protein
MRMAHIECYDHFEVVAVNFNCCKFAPVRIPHSLLISLFLYFLLFAKSLSIYYKIFFTNNQAKPLQIYEDSTRRKRPIGCVTLHRCLMPLTLTRDHPNLSYPSAFTYIDENSNKTSQIGIWNF